ncbi:hypothetical protein [Halosimplex amylolyticum]|uniref:hypothetical protein n=1 Tax=Halosimplex amylolyticum TaxID=3396616 RepID=UPI003F577D08
MGVVARTGRLANRPLGAGVAFGGSALLYTLAYVRFVSPYGLFVVSATVLTVSATVAAFCSGALVWRYPLSWTAERTYRGHGLAGSLVGVMTLVLAPPLAVLGMMGPLLTGWPPNVSLITPLLIAGTLLSAIAYGMVGTVIALVATAGTPVIVTTVTGLGLGYLRRRYDGPFATSEGEAGV